MLSRKNQPDTYTELPVEWCQNLKKTLEEIYQSQCDNLNKRFDIYTELYSDELVIATSLTDQNDQNIIPVTYLISCDLSPNQDYDKFLSQLVDQIGEFFEYYFNSKDWDEYQSSWQESSVDKTKFFYKISRENIIMSKLADQLINIRKN